MGDWQEEGRSQGITALPPWVASLTTAVSPCGAPARTWQALHGATGPSP